jgi:hypothetical protein
MRPQISLAGLAQEAEGAGDRLNKQSSKQIGRGRRVAAFLFGRCCRWGFLRGRGHRLTHLGLAAERNFYFRSGSRCARWLIRHPTMLRAVRGALDAIGAAIEGFGGVAFDRPSAMMALELVRLHAGLLVFELGVGNLAAGFDVRHAASSTFKRIKVGQVVKSRRCPSKPHDLRAAWAMRRLWALVAHGHWSFRPNVPEPAADVVGRGDYGLLFQANKLFRHAAHEHVIERVC